MAEAGGDKRPGMGRGVRIVFYLSLALNLAVVGLVVGALIMASPSGQDRRPARGGEVGFGPIMKALAPQDRRQMGMEMRRALRQAGKTRAAQRAVLEEVVVALAADPFEPEAVEPLLGRQFEEAEFRLNLARQVFLAHLEEMSAAERAALAERLQAEIDKPFDGRRGPGGGGLRGGEGRSE
ncbi:MAG: periplasmic heavy metal sensor [Pseudomonadota bacterium]